MKNLSRREMLIRSAQCAACAAAVSAAGLLWAPRAEALKKEEYPWPYRKIDPQKAAAIAYENYYKNGCSYAVTSGILIPLREAIGPPYTVLPLEAFAFGRGGVMDWGTTCGALLGAGIATGLAAGKKGEEILNEVINWYCDTELPIFVPQNPRASIKTVNKSDSPLCHVSVGKWMKKEGVALSDPRRKERCARLSADVAMKTVQMLNLRADGAFETKHGSQSMTYGITTQNNCTDCHGTAVPSVPQGGKT